MATVLGPLLATAVIGPPWLLWEAPMAAMGGPLWLLWWVPVVTVVGPPWPL